MLRAAVIALVLCPVSSAVAQRAKQSLPGCLGNLGTKEYFGSAEQVRELQRRVRAFDAKTCPQVGFRFAAGPRRARVPYDRTTGSMVRVALWQGEDRPSWEYWSGVTDASLLRDEADGGIDTGQYHNGTGTESLVPRSTRRALDRLRP